MYMIMLCIMLYSEFAKVIFFRQKKQSSKIFLYLQRFSAYKYQFLFSSTLNHYQHCVDKDFYIEGEIHIFDI